MGDDEFDDLFAEKTSMYVSLRKAGLKGKMPLRNVRWVNHADDGVMVLNVWRFTLREREGQIFSAFLRKNRREIKPAKKRKLTELFEALKGAHGSTVRVVLLDKRDPTAERIKGTKFDPHMWSVHDLGDRYELLRGGRGPAWIGVPETPTDYGVLKPKKRWVMSERIERITRVKFETLKRAGKRCEIANCEHGVEFKSPDVHHITRLGDQGSDHTDNTVALCPACHAKVHRGIPSVQARMTTMIENIRRSR